MDLAVVQCSQRIPIAFSMVADGFGSQLLDGNEDANTISDFLDAHLFQHELIAFNKITASNIVDYGYALAYEISFLLAQRSHVRILIGSGTDL